MASHPTTASSKSFGLVLSMALLIVAAWKYKSGAWNPVWASVGGILLLITLLAPRLLRPVKNLWLRLGHLIGRVLSPIFLIIVYAVSIVPVGLSLKAFRKDALKLTLDPNRESYWIWREPPGPDSKSLKNQF